MNPEDRSSALAQALRARAEAALPSHPARELSPLADADRLPHELRVHKIELELQNEELLVRRAELEASLTRYTELYDFAPVAYATLAPDGSIREANLACGRMLGVERVLLQGRRLGLFISDASREGFNHWLEDVFAGREPPRCQVDLAAVAVGKEPCRTVQMDARYTSHGESCHAVLVDVTDRLRLDEVVAIRTLEAQLRESQKMEAIGVLAGGIAHDFNNILGGILGNVGLAQQDVGVDHPALRPLAQINQASLRARGLVQQILTFSRRRSEPYAPLALRPRLEEALALLQATLPAGVQLQVSLTDLPLAVLADATQLQQVVINLCTNAWQALQGVGSHIAVSLDVAAVAGPSNELGPPLPPGRYAYLSVTDDGCGVAPEAQEHIFEPFFTTKPVGQGTGLGLAVVHGIVHAHGGAIVVDSVLGQGTTVGVYLPLINAPDGSPPAELRALVTSPGGQGQHVLYIDDDEVMLLMVQEMLNRLGYHVTVCEEPLKALATVREHPLTFDLVVTDLNMPELSGLDLARSIADIRPDLPVVISSGFVDNELRSEAARVGVRDVIRKENIYEELGHVVHSVLKASD